MKFIKYFTFFLSIMAASQSYATKQSGNGTIRTMMNASGGWLISINHPIKEKANPASCHQANFFLHADNLGDQVKKEFYSLILSAYVSAKPLTFFVDDKCNANGYNVVKGIWTNWN